MKSMQFTSRFFIFALVFSTLLAVSHAQKTLKECTEENEFWGCQSPTRTCQRLCENRKLKSVHVPCKLSCEKACVCEAGYLRNGTNGECVYASLCNDGQEGAAPLAENTRDEEQSSRDSSL